MILKQNAILSIIFIVLLITSFIFVFSDGIPMLETSPDEITEGEETEEVDEREDKYITIEYLKNNYSVYRGNAEGYGGELVIDLVFDNDNIIDIIIVKDSETESIAEPAFEKLIEDMLEKQSPEVDIVSGATDTSKAMIEAVKKAKGKSTEILLGQAEGYGGELIVKVILEEDEIIDIFVVEDSETDSIAEPAFEKLIEDMLKKQSPEVDIVSGATDTSEAMIEAVKKTLE